MARAYKKRAVKFSNKKHARKGLMASFLGLLSLIIFVSLLGVAFVSRGNINKIGAVLGVFDIIISIVGVVLGILSYKEKDSIYLYSGVGTTLNGILVFLWISIYMRGFYGL